MENPLKYAAKFSRQGILAARNVGDRLGSNHTWRPERGKGISPAFFWPATRRTEALQSQKPHSRSCQMLVLPGLLRIAQLPRRNPIRG